MRIYGSDSETATTWSLDGLVGWARRHTALIQLTAMALVFLLGALAQQRGMIGAMRDELGLSDRTLAAIEGMLREPDLTLAALRQAGLPKVYVDVGFEHLQRIEAKREQALRLGLLLASDDDFVPADLRYRDRTISVKLRLKGDEMDHLTTDKWSYRIHVKGDDQLFGMRRFSIQHPWTRKGLLEWGWLEHLRLEGVLAPRYRFIEVVFNGSPKGIYALEEHFSKELLESQERREGVIVRFDESPYWQRYAQLGHAPGWYDFITNVGEYGNALIGTSRASRVANDPALSKEQETAVGLLRAFQEGDLSASQVFDAALLGRFLAVSELWHTYHGLYWNNMHFCYNPITARLEPIGFDGTSDPSRTLELYALNHPWLIQALRDPIVAEAYVKELNRTSQPDYLEQVRAQLDEPLRQLRLALYPEFPDYYSVRVWETLEERQSYIRRSLGASNLILAFANNDDESDGSGSTDTMEVAVRNILALPVEVLGFQVGDRFISASATWAGMRGQVDGRNGHSSVILAGDVRGDDDPVEYAMFHVPLCRAGAELRDRQLPEVRVVVRLLGMPTTHETPVLQSPQILTEGPLPPMPTVEQALNTHAFLKAGEAQDTLLVRPGDWNVAGDLILPPGVQLQAGPGTTLRFAHDAILMSTGPLEFRGTAEAPVVMAPQDSSWAGLVVLEARELSVWEYVTVKGTRGIEREGWILTGGITFYESPIEISHCRVLRSEAEDGINVVRSSLEFRDCEFGDFVSDAFDGDFTQGVIAHCSFHDTEGDAIDVSGSRLSVSDVALRNIGDKGISVGEASQVDVKGLVATSIGIAVASKDLSHVGLETATIERASIAGLAAYEKKQEHGPATLEAWDIKFTGVPQKTLIQAGSWISLEDKRIEGSETDTEALYEAGVLGY